MLPESRRRGNGPPGCVDAFPRIRIRGARVHNLRDVDVDIPRNQLVVITGPSGSGKSSLAFDTLYAEGKRQYIESLSLSARQLLDQVARPEVDLIDGLQPTLCIDQRPGIQNPRSTVGTVTEIYDYLRLLMARLGTAACYRCGAPIQQQTVEQILQRLCALPAGTKTMVLSPLIRGRKGRHKEVFARVRKAGFLRVRVDGLVCELDEVPHLQPQKKHHIDAVVDRVIVRPNIESRLTDSVRLALDHGEGLMSVCYLEQGGDGQQQWRDELLSTRYACPDCNISYEEVEPRTFSFNSPYGACPVCQGLGRCDEFDPELVIPDRNKTLADGAVAAWDSRVTATQKTQCAALAQFLATRKLSPSTPLKELSESDYQRLLHGDEKKFLGLLMLLEKELATTTSRSRLAQLTRFRADVTCQSCAGSRLRKEATSVKLKEKGIHEIVAMPVGTARQWFDKLKFHKTEQPVAAPLVSAIAKRLEFLLKVGLDYLTLDRASDTLSGGELQRVRLATSIGSGLVGVCYVLDEPSIGLHQRDNRRLIDSLRDLQSEGNTVLVVEHDESVMRVADRLIDMGPGAGKSGGRIVAAGSPQQVSEHTDSLTGQYLAGAKSVPVPALRRRTARTRSLVILHVGTHNLQHIDVRIPLGALVCVTGVSGSGKSFLINGTLAPALVRRLGGVSQAPGPFRGLRGVSQIDKVIQIDQSPIGRSPRSNAATYTSVFDDIRKVFAGTREAKQRGFTASRFSFNNKAGRCDACQGQGVQKLEMSFLPDLFVTCDQCGGARFNRQTLIARYRGRTIADILDMNIADAAQFFANFAGIARVLECLLQVGLGYMPLGQPSTTLSGGEAQRIKLATELSRIDSGKTIYLLDEPTTGLHFDDIRRLMDVLQQLVDKGNTVLVIEHNLEVVKCADWIIDLGPEGGAAGGRIVAEGTPEDVAQCEASYTGRYLHALLGRKSG